MGSGAGFGGMTTISQTRTTTALLIGLHDPRNDAAWRELLDRCAPLLVASARRLGLSGADVDDAVQSALATFVESYRRGQYDRSRGRLSGYLLTILRSRAVDLQRAAARGRVADGQRALPELPDEVELERVWLQERQRRILDAALHRLRGERVDDRSLQAFELYGLRGIAIDEVSRQLGMTREEIYNAKHRIAKRLQPIVARLDDLYEDL